jgi:hypothetical protein
MSRSRLPGLYRMTDDAMALLAPFLGEWQLETSLGPPGAVRARSVFEWALDGRFLVERSEVDLPEAPDGLSVVGADAARGGYLQHYFDSRGVVRLYAMTFDGRVWTLRREDADFSPLDFAQRYTGEFSDDGTRITGRWEIRHPGRDWETDFDLSYVRVAGAA